MSYGELLLGPCVDGERLRGEGRETHQILNPATGLALGDLVLATKTDLDRALDCAAGGFESWRKTDPLVRAGILARAAALLRERTNAIATLATLEQGKPHGEAVTEINTAAALIDFHAGEVPRIYGRVLARPPGQRSFVLPQPVGPVAAFCAWNFPIMNPVRKLSPAIAAGCSVILKPSEETPASALAVLECFHDAGLPHQIAQVVFGVPSEVSRHLLTSGITKKLSFTGSVPVGRELLRVAAGTVMRTTMELGGHCPVLVFDDCDLERALDMLVAHKFRNAGQVCVSPTRFFIQQNIYEKFVDGFAKRAASLRVGDGLAADTQMGPLANPRRPVAVRALIDDAVSRGARVLTGGTDDPGGGFFFKPTVLAEATDDSRATSEEPFGPVALMRPFKDMEDAINSANRLPFGLGAYCFTESGRRQNLLCDELEAGMVAINGVRMSWGDSPFGGVKDSGYGSEDGPEGIAAHLNTKAIHIQ